MTSRILLIAMREFRQIAATRSFWLTLLILPLVFAIGPLASRFMDRSETERVMLIDRAGGEAGRTIARRLELDQARRELAALARYVDRHHLRRADPDAPWSRQDRAFDDADVARFVAAGGVAGALPAIRRIRAADAPEFEAPEPQFVLVPVPADLSRAPPARLGALLRPLLRPGGDAKPLDYALYVPAEFGRSSSVRLWSNGSPSADLVQSLQQVLGRELQARYLAARGVPVSVSGPAAALAPTIAVETPSRETARQRTLIRSILPLACAYILLMSLILSGSWMLQGSVEERGNKLIEAMLACVSPHELMYGKLIGTVATGLSMVATWAACGLFAAYATQGSIADMIRPALEPVSTIGAVATILYFFVAGYVMVAMIFLAIGATADSMREAQGYLTPVLLVIMLPVTILVQAVLRGAEGIGVQVLTWVPIYTPFAVLARLGSGMPTWQVIGSGVLLAAFVAVEVVLLGRVFRHSLLAGGRPGMAALGRMMLRSDAR